MSKTWVNELGDRTWVHHTLQLTSFVNLYFNLKAGITQHWIETVYFDFRTTEGDAGRSTAHSAVQRHWPDQSESARLPSLPPLPPPPPPHGGQPVTWLDLSLNSVVTSKTWLVMIVTQNGNGKYHIMLV